MGVDEQHAFITCDQVSKNLLQQIADLSHTKFKDCIQQSRTALILKGL